MFSLMQVNGKEHNLAGPIQLINHSCSEWNARYVLDEESVFIKV